jgi:hypothetical protein
MDAATKAAIERISAHPGEILLATNPPSMQLVILILMLGILGAVLFGAFSAIDRYGSRRDVRSSRRWFVCFFLAGAVASAAGGYLQEWTRDLASRKALLETLFKADDSCRVATRAIATGGIQDLDPGVERALFKSCGRRKVLVAIANPSSVYVLSAKKWRGEATIPVTRPYPTGIAD